MHCVAAHGRHGSRYACGGFEGPGFDTSGKRRARPRDECHRRACGQNGPDRVQAQGSHSQGSAIKMVDQNTKMEMFETGIKVIDLIEPYLKGGKIGLFGGAGVGKTVIIQELINNIAKCLFFRAGKPVGNSQDGESAFNFFG